MYLVRIVLNIIATCIRRKMAHLSAQNKFFYKKFLSMVFLMVL
uniref:Uncharacterized protein n=1 Tax=Escherichia coli TaxID=562 RepID=A0A8E6P3M3_ECOLX|nr:hypothetical protein FDGFPMFE_00018 [Escherichia coli]UWM20737.1 hypothetical protein [Proteus vulgaris]UWM20951.1 hypothetical protein [Proteus mirabilis]QVQ62198.1 hypothetical protein FDGFPMFE_00156 [Escherichia coli]QVQ62225.1 hypothetical protein FDGFPMFE_00183 [Escherichia coli]